VTTHLGMSTSIRRGIGREVGPRQQASDEGESVAAYS
jgi:hypothetical protein